jgi:hypothetical protein
METTKDTILGIPIKLLPLWIQRCARGSTDHKFANRLSITNHSGPSKKMDHVEVGSEGAGCRVQSKMW